MILVAEISVDESAYCASLRRIDGVHINLMCSCSSDRLNYESSSSFVSQVFFEECIIQLVQ
jgi:hypothetical protein